MTLDRQAPSAETIRRALQCIPANLPRDGWARVAMALKSELPDESGFALFDEWSRGADNDKARAARDTWRSVMVSRRLRREARHG